MLRTNGIDPLSLTRAATAAVGRIDSNQSFFDVRSMDDRRDAAVWQERLAGLLVTLFGAIAAALAIIGLSGLMAYLVAQRRREVGVRLALGAEPRAVVWLFVPGSVGLVAIGLVIGAVLAWIGGSLVQPLIFSPSATDRVAFFVAAMCLTAVALIASWVPARHAARIDPVEVLRGE